MANTNILVDILWPAIQREIAAHPEVIDQLVHAAALALIAWIRTQTQPTA